MRVLFSRSMAALLSLSAPAISAAAPPAVTSGSLQAGEHQIIVNEVRLWYRVSGKPTGTPVVFLHGGPGEGSQSFEMLAGKKLEPSLRMIYLDQRGSGRSERPWNDAYSMSLLVEDLEQLRVAWHIPQLRLIGHSVGTIVAMEYAARYPSRVEAMVLAASGPDLPAAFDLQCARVSRDNPQAYRRAVAANPTGSRRTCNMWGDGVFEKGGMQAFVDANMFPDPAIEAAVNRADNANGLHNSGELARALISQGLTDYQFKRGERLTMPTLVIAGGRDFQAAIEPQRAFVRTLKHGRLIEYPQSGHFMFAEDSSRFARDVTAFFDR